MFPYGINMLPVLRVSNNTSDIIHEVDFYLDGILAKEAKLRSIKPNENKQSSIVNNILPGDATYSLSMTIDGSEPISIMSDFKRNTLGIFAIDVARNIEHGYTINMNRE